MKNITKQKKLHKGPSEKTRWAYCMQAIEPTSETINKMFPGYHPQWIQQSQRLTIGAANFISLRKALGMSREQCAAYLRVGLKTIIRWERGWNPVPFVAFELLRLVLESVKFRTSHQAWDGWFIGENGALHSPDIGGNGFTPEQLIWSTMTRNEAALLRNEVTQLQTELNEAITENTRLRQMFLSNGVIEELASMQGKINGLMDRIGTAHVITFPLAESKQPEQPQLKAWHILPFPLTDSEQPQEKAA